MPIPQSPSTDDWDGSDTSQTTSPVSPNSQNDLTLKELATTKEYRSELKKYLTSFLEKEAIQGPAPKRTASRHKLSKLNHAQYLELARDVYDEMTRRTVHEMEVPFLPVNDIFHPRRNQARQKLATLPEHRFMDLSSDVYHELVRRFPHTVLVKNENDLPPLPPKDEFYANSSPMQSEWSHDQILPAKDVLQIDQHYHAYSPHPLDPIDLPSPQPQQAHQWADSLDNLIADIDSMVKPYSQSKEDLAKRKHSSDIELLQKQHEKEVNELKKRIHELEQTSLESKVEEDMCKRYEALEKEHQQLQLEKRQQFEAVKKVKKEINDILQQLDQLQIKNEKITQEKNEALDLVHQLQTDMKMLEFKHKALRQHIRAAKVESTSTSSSDSQRSSALTVPWDYNTLKPSIHGIISYKTVLAYQIHAEEFVKSARSSDRSDIIRPMKSLVSICKDISQQVDDSDIGHAERSHVEVDDRVLGNEENEDVSTSKVLERYRSIRRQFATNLYQLVLACQSFAYGSGVYPLNLLDSSLGHLTSVAIELVQLLGVYE
ncbi:hypothetical protein DM01DRAFT_1236454 [Hesseltinella vesiculosa]|uniref:GIT Spa2 homology (SHD) domain-containing protein n=1 Tax=Hesseltinella vesiculosa TaxID=101127 RepID=A0A1X2GLU4_9FUNG|nr:hypothetical protein DM01DRAFT_1236454 [Hesseltinella vesiculosa]